MPNGNGQTWAFRIAKALVVKAAKGDVRAINEIGNRLEGKPLQAIEMDVDATSTLGERLEKARKRVSEGKP